MPSCPRPKIGFLINPIAGMGGAVGLKGTDGLAEEATARGAKPLAQDRARSCMRVLAPRARAEGITFLTAGGDMGESVMNESGLKYSVVYKSQEKSSAEDTKAACRAFIDDGADLILFCGGDGTARDVAFEASKQSSKQSSEQFSEQFSNQFHLENPHLEDSNLKNSHLKNSNLMNSNLQVPLLGIPAGVKMHSGVFAVSPEAAAELALGYACGDLLARETEIVDVDEELYRSGELQTRLYATARTPYKPTLVQERKRIYSSANEEEFKDQIALFSREFMRDGSAYILGAGTTTGRIAEIMGLEKTLLGVDVVQNERLIVKDASEMDLLKLLEREKSVKIIVSPIGAQGFILGRGSQQISASVLKSVGAENLIIVSTPHKLAELKHLLVYTGDPEMDGRLSGRLLVVTGYRIAQRKDVKAASAL